MIIVLTLRKLSISIALIWIFVKTAEQNEQRRISFGTFIRRLETNDTTIVTFYIKFDNVENCNRIPSSFSL